MIPPQHRKHVLGGLVPLSVLVSSVLMAPRFRLESLHMETPLLSTSR